MDRTQDASPGFEEALAELKRRGCAILMTGRAPDGAIDAASARFLGREPDRVRTFALVGRGVATARRRLDAAGPGRQPAVAVDAVRDGPAAPGPAETVADGRLERRPVDRSLDALAAGVSETVADEAEERGPFEASQFRLCVDSLRPLVHRCETDRLAGFVSGVVRSVASVDGMAHVVCRADPDDPTDPAHPVVETIRSSFDVIVEFRPAGIGIERRWTLPDYGIETAWVDVVGGQQRGDRPPASGSFETVGSRRGDSDKPTVYPG